MIKTKQDILHIIFLFILSSAVVFYSLKSLLVMKYGIDISYYSLEFLFVVPSFIFITIGFYIFFKIKIPVVKSNNHQNQWYGAFLLGIVAVIIDKFYVQLISQAEWGVSWAWLSLFHPVLWTIIMSIYWRFR